MYLLLRENPGFLSKAVVKNVPLIGFYAKMHQCIFFSRKDSEERENILEVLEERVKMAEKGKINPIIIFPEGTTSNGRGLLKFKKGPF